MEKQIVRYTVETITAGQQRAYGDSEYRCLITVESTRYGKDGLHPWVLHGDVEARIRKDEADRAAGRMSGGQSPEQLRKEQRDWAKKMVKALFHGFREKGDDDGIKEGTMEAAFAPTLKSLEIDHKAGTIRAFVNCTYTD